MRQGVINNPLFHSLKRGLSVPTCLFMALPPSVSNRKWWLGQLSPHSQPLCGSSFSQHSPARLSRRTLAALSPGNSWTELSSHWLHHRSSLGLSGEYMLSIPPLALSSLSVFTCTQMCVCEGDTRRENSWITEARQDFWTALEQMVDELDQGIKTPEIENASVADGWDCGRVSWGLGAWALLCSLFFPSSLPQKERRLSLTCYIYNQTLYITGPNTSLGSPCWCGNEHPHL